MSEQIILDAGHASRPSADVSGGVHALLNPRNVVIAGASDKPGNWPQRVWRNLRRYGFPGAVYPLNPSRDAVWGERCYATFKDLPEPPDHVVVLVPARFVCATLREAAACGARSATVMTSGFGEQPDANGQGFAVALRDLIAETGLAVSGPNCLGNFNVHAGFFSLPDDRPHLFKPGPVAVIGQSGGIVMAIKRTLEERGINTGAMVTSGNEDGLTTADYIAYFAEQPEIRVIVCYLEAVRDAAAFLAACRRARDAGKPVLVVKLGTTTAGRAAAAAHTGALAGAIEAFDAVAGDAGVIRLGNLDDVVEAVELCANTPPPGGARLGSITVSGGMRALLLEAAEHHGLVFDELSDATRARMTALLSVGTIVGNPLDAGYAALSSARSYLECVQILLDDPTIDILLLQDELPREPGTKKEENMRAVDALVARSRKSVAYVSMISYGLTDYSRQLRAELTHVAFLQEVDKTLRVLSGVAAYAGRLRQPPVPAPAPNLEAVRLLAELSARQGPATLDELHSKRLLRAYGIATPPEEVAATEAQAVAIAARIGYPVVAKLVCASIPHKSDVGGVVVGIGNEPDLRRAFHTIEAIPAALPGAPMSEGVLVAGMVVGGLELVLGMSHDPEMGPVVLFGAGGVDLEMTRDVALAAAPLDDRGARALIARTRVSRLIDAHRGKPAKDLDAAVQALIALSHLVVDARGGIEAIDVNPFVLLESGGVALDALVVLRR